MTLLDHLINVWGGGFIALGYLGVAGIWMRKQRQIDRAAPWEATRSSLEESRVD